MSINQAQKQGLTSKTSLVGHQAVKQLYPNLVSRSADNDRGPGGLWEILPAAGHAGRDADHRGKSLLEQVRRHKQQHNAGHSVHTILLLRKAAHFILSLI